MTGSAHFFGQRIKAYEEDRGNPKETPGCKLSSLSFVFLSEMSTRVPDADWLTAFPLSLIGRRLRHESRCVSTHPYSCLHLDVTKNTFHKSGEVTHRHARRRRNRDGVVRVGQ